MEMERDKLLARISDAQKAAWASGDKLAVAALLRHRQWVETADDNELETIVNSLEKNPRTCQISWRDS
jgi:hypothetical protein